MSDPQNDDFEGPNREANRAQPRQYGADWVGVNRSALEARRRAQGARARMLREEELERRSQELKELKRFVSASGEGRHFQSGSKKASNNDSGAKRPLPKTTSLVSSLRVQNLRSFVGSHEVPLAPLTLIYGPNAAGKSTILFALKLLMGVVDAGRSDAIHAWNDAFGEFRASSVLTYSEPERDDPSGSHWRSPLGVGANFKTRSGAARVDLEYEINPVGPSDVHSTSIGLLDEGSVGKKRFVPEDFDGSEAVSNQAGFGRDALPSFVVTETFPSGESITESRVIDPELFTHPDQQMQTDLFELAFLMRYFGAHRGDPGKEYEPAQGRFNSSEYDFFRKPRIGQYDQYDLLNQVLDQLEIPYEFEKDALAEMRGSGVQRWVMRDTRSGAPVRLDQVGYGVSQLLPVVDVCVHARKQLICVEEPELHLHPRLQARLGNLFATAVVKRGNQVIVETHSENILLRLRRLIRGGLLRSEDVAVLYVDNTDEGGATVSRLRLGDKGELLDPWPTGFFDDSLADVLGITE